MTATLEYVLELARSGKYDVNERIPAVETDSYYRMLEFRKSPTNMVDYPLTKHAYLEFKKRTEGEKLGKR